MATSSDEMTTNLTTRRFKDGNNVWKRYNDMIFSADTTYKCPTYLVQTPPCQSHCPSGHDVRSWLNIVCGIHKPTEPGMTPQEYAFRRYVDANPFPSIMGRVCPAPCQQGCNRNHVDDYVGINAIDQYIGDSAIKAHFKLPRPGKETGRKVAVVGGGPGGLAAAFNLRRMGHGVTIFEELAGLGGMMRYGIPGYRIPRSILGEEIKRILDMGVETRMNTRVGRDVSMEDVVRDFDAVVWAIGAHKGRGLVMDNFDAPNCLIGVEFLRAFNQGLLKLAEPRVVVIGGGDTSIDVASVALRLGYLADASEDDRIENVISGKTVHKVPADAVRRKPEVILTSLFPVDKMIATEEEVQAALREGVDIRGGIMPLEMVKDQNGRAVAMRMCECDMAGMKPIPKEGTEFTIEGDVFISAIGQYGDMEGLGDLDNGRGFIENEPNFQVEGKPGQFCIGDIVRPHLLTTAIGQARVAAEGVDAYLKDVPRRRPKVDTVHFKLLKKFEEVGRDPEPFVVAERGDLRGTDEAKFAVHNFEDRTEQQVVPLEQLYLGHFAFTPRAKRGEIHIGVDEVLGNFKERMVGLSDEQAKEEAGRCMSCGLCFECDNCVIFCPQDAVFRVKKDKYATGRYVDTDYTRCIGCHICADVCPTGYIQMGMGE